MGKREMYRYIREDLYMHLFSLSSIADDIVGWLISRSEIRLKNEVKSSKVEAINTTDLSHLLTVGLNQLITRNHIAGRKL